MGDNLQVRVACNLSFKRTVLILPHNPGTLILRSDASTVMGTGHVMRCLALAQAWQDARGKAVFAMAGPPAAVRERLLSEGMDVVSLEVEPGSHDDARQVADLARQRGAIWTIVDVYNFGASYQRDLKAAGLRVLFVDDNGHADHYTAELVVNQNAHAEEGLYPKREPYTRLLLGSPYVMLRREFEPWHEWKREIPDLGRKILITMGGSDNPDFAQTLRRFRNHGISSDARQRQSAGQWQYEMVLLGFNYRLTDIACALGLSQLKKVGENLARRRTIAARYAQAFRNLAGVIPPATRPDVNPAWHLYPVRIDSAAIEKGRAEIFRTLRAENIGVNVHYIPVHLHPYYRQRFGYKGGEYPIAEAAYSALISLPMFHAMTDQDVDDVIGAMTKVLS